MERCHGFLHTKASIPPSSRHLLALLGGNFFFDAARENKKLHKSKSVSKTWKITKYPHRFLETGHRSLAVWGVGGRRADGSGGSEYKQGVDHWIIAGEEEVLADPNMLEKQVFCQE